MILRMRAPRLLALGAMIVSVVAGGAFASAADEEPKTPLDPEPEAAPAASPDAPGDSAAFTRISDEEETIYAVQRKAYLVRKRIELTPMFAASFTDRFVETYAPAASVTYHFAENFGLEFYGAYMFPTESGLRREIFEEHQLTPEIAKVVQMLWAVGIGVQWSPIYGKVQIFGRTLGNFNLYVGVGGGIGQTRVECISSQALDPERGFDPAVCPMLEEVPGADDRAARFVYEPARLQIMGAFSGGMRFYFSDKVGLKFEVKNYVFPARIYRPGNDDSTQRFTDAIRNNVFAQLGLSFLFGGED